MFITGLWGREQPPASRVAHAANIISRHGQQQGNESLKPRQRALLAVEPHIYYSFPLKKKSHLSINNNFPIGCRL
jgi:hypothetical protein